MPFVSQGGKSCMYIYLERATHIYIDRFYIDLYFGYSIILIVDLYMV